MTNTTIEAPITSCLEKFEEFRSEYNKLVKHFQHQADTYQSIKTNALRNQQEIEFETASALYDESSYILSELMLNVSSLTGLSLLLNDIKNS